MILLTHLPSPETLRATDDPQTLLHAARFQDHRARTDQYIPDLTGAEVAALEAAVEAARVSRGVPLDDMLFAATLPQTVAVAEKIFASDMKNKIAAGSAGATVFDDLGGDLDVLRGSLNATELAQLWAQQKQERAALLTPIERPRLLIGILGFMRSEVDSGNVEREKVLARQERGLVRALLEKDPDLAKAARYFGGDLYSFGPSIDEIWKATAERYAEALRPVARAA
jgi:hypothetical protein